MAVAARSRSLWLGEAGLGALILFGMGIVLAGGLIPLEKYLWYQIPLIGVYAIGAAWALRLRRVWPFRVRATAEAR